MSRKPRKPIPVNVISGPLGVGKTTTINHLMKQRPENERWAILVNEYGLVGLDAALMEAEPVPGERPGVEIREVAGGCICCSAGFLFEMSLVRLLQRRPDRLLIEPTGLAALSGILDTLDRSGICESVDVRSIVCLLDSARLDEAREREEVRDQIEAADVLLASRADLASEEQLDSFDVWARSLFPPKRLVDRVESGQVDLELLDLVAGRTDAVRRKGHRHGTDHAHDHAPHEPDAPHAHETSDSSPAEIECNESEPIVRRTHESSVASTIGWVCWDGCVFDAKRTSCWLGELARTPGTRRLKAVLRTNEGWWAFNFVDGIEETRPSGYRRDSRLELVIDGDRHPNADDLDRALRGCLTSSTDSNDEESPDRSIATPKSTRE